MKHISLITCLLLAHSPLHACLPMAKPETPPKLINGQWVQAAQANSQALLKADHDMLENRAYDFVFSATLRRGSRFQDKQLSFLESKNVWQGQVPKTLDIELDDMPTPRNCDPIVYDKEYLFFGILGSRHKPIILKTFRPLTADRKELLGTAKKRWLRGRLIQLR